jgi:hypothetical protein
VVDLEIIDSKASDFLKENTRSIELLNIAKLLNMLKDKGIV